MPIQLFVNWTPAQLRGQGSGITDCLQAFRGEGLCMVTKQRGLSFLWKDLKRHMRDPPWGKVGMSMGEDGLALWPRLSFTLLWPFCPMSCPVMLRGRDGSDRKR